jgi:signal transduction histidine kinase/ligand-binding sensor domain-containing protein
MKYIFLLLTALFSLPLTFLSSANVAFYYYGIENGLSETRITHIGQDSTGFIWLAGDHALFRFDGSQFKDYYNNSTNGEFKLNGKISCIHTDSKGVLRIGTEFGFYTYNGVTDRFDGPEKSWEKVHVKDIEEDYAGLLWIASDEGLASFNAENSLTEWFTSPDTIKPMGHNVLPSSDLTHITSQPDGKIWMTYQTGGIFLFDPKTLKTEDYTQINGKNFKNSIISNLLYKNKCLYFSTLNEGFYWYETETKKLENHNFDSYGYTIHSFQFATDSILWLASNNGLIQFNIANGNWMSYTNEPLNPLSLSRTAVIFVFTDRDHNLWVSNGLKGVNYGLNNVPFSHFEISPNGINQLENKEVTSICFDRAGNMWVGYEAGFIEKFDDDRETKKRYNLNIKNSTGTAGSILAFYIDSHDNIWAGGWQTGLHRFNEKSNAFELVPVQSDLINHNFNAADIRGITEDKDGNIWVSFHGFGIGCYNPVTNQIELFRFNSQNPSNSISNDYTFDLCADGKDNIWISTAHGLTRYNRAEKKFTSFFHEEGNSFSLCSNTVNTVYCDGDGNIWVGTTSGLNLWLPESDTFQQVLTGNDIPFLNLSSILSVKTGELWLTSGSEIIKVNYTSIKGDGSVEADYLSFGRSAGLLSTSFFPRSAAVNNEGYMFFGGNESIDFFNPDEVSDWKIPASEPVITEITIDGNPLTDKYLTEAGNKNSIKLRHTDRMMIIRFSSLRFNEWKLRKFRYKLEGFHQDWIYPHNEQVATFTALPPGKYNFLLEFQGNSKLWQKIKEPLEIIVKPPFWFTWPFILVIIIFVVTTVYLYQRQKTRIMLARHRELEDIIEKRTSELLKKNEELEAANQTKNKFFSIISHDLRSPFSGLLGILNLLNEPDSEIPSSKKQEMLKHAYDSAKITFELLETLLTWARSQMNETICKPGNHNICLMLEKNIELKSTAALAKRITFIRNMPENLVAYFDSDMINTVIRNILSNAIKFNYSGGLIYISASGINNEVVVKIADNGIGMQQSEIDQLFDIGRPGKTGTLGEKGTGLGLIICKEFVEKNNGRLWVTENEPQGTIFYFSLPVSKI